MDTKRTVIISVRYDPPISGYGGWDEWEISTTTGRQRDAIGDAIDAIVKQHKGEFTGVN